MRLFVGVWPDDATRHTLAALPRPDDASLRWSSPERWHVTLEFIGEVPDEEVDGLIAAVRTIAASFPQREVTLGPATRVLSGRILMAPVAGLDDVARAFSDEPFNGHLTLARARQRNGRIPREFAGTPIRASWTPREISLVCSHVGRGPARYETIASGAFAP